MRQAVGDPGWTSDRLEGSHLISEDGWGLGLGSPGAILMVLFRAPVIRGAEARILEMRRDERRQALFQDALTSDSTAATKIPERNAIHAQSASVKKIVKTSSEKIIASAADMNATLHP